MNHEQAAQELKTLAGAQRTPDMLAIEKASRERYEQEKRAYQAEQAAEKQADVDPLNDELQAMRSIARTLEKLPYDARIRVVRWLEARSNGPFMGPGAPVNLAGNRLYP